MKKYILKRLLSTIPILLIVSIVIFFIVHLTPGDPARVMLGEGASEEAVENLRESMGLNDPILLQYFKWVADIAQGDLGNSYAMNKPVTEVIGEHIIPTLNLTGMSLIITLLIAIPLGILAAKKRGTIVDNSATVFSLVGISIPAFLMGLFLVLLFSVK